MEKDKIILQQTKVNERQANMMQKQANEIAFHKRLRRLRQNTVTPHNVSDSRHNQTAVGWWAIEVIAWWHVVVLASEYHVVIANVDAHIQVAAAAATTSAIPSVATIHMEDFTTMVAASRTMLGECRK
eukprot:SAG31_NODE_656_length_13120_cov_10.091237_10_plen_128_part_00